MTDVLLIIAEQNFRDEELLNTKAELEKAGFSTTIASKSMGIKKGMLGATANAELSLSEVKVDDYRAVVFIGGQGSSQYFNDAESLNIAKSAVLQSKIVAAICIAPIILANSGMLKGKNATVWDSGDGTFISKLEAKEANYINQAVVRDGNIITANGPAAAKQFGKEIVSALKQ